MIKSMTGCGTSKREEGNIFVRIDISCLNGRSFKAAINAPSSFNVFYSQIESLVKNYISRGTVNINIKYRNLKDNPLVHLNLAKFKLFKERLARISKELDLKNDLTLSSIILIPDLWKGENFTEEDPDMIWDIIRPCLEAALKHTEQMRKKEGMNTKCEIDVILGSLTKTIMEIGKEVPRMVSDYQKKFERRISELLKGTNTNAGKNDIAKEVAFYAQKSDISEEVGRFKSHIKGMHDLFKAKDPAGRRFEFLAQEMGREANTMSSKVYDIRMTKLILDVKADVDRIREQVLNIE